MIHYIAIAVIAALLQAAAAPGAVMKDLTVPVERLPEGCAFAPRLRKGRNPLQPTWGPFPANPWIGTEKGLMGLVRQIMDLSRMTIPDGPAPDAAGIERYIAGLTEGVEEAYAAIYEQDEKDVVMVHAVRYAQPQPFPDPAPVWGPGVNSARISIGAINVSVVGSGGCFSAVSEHVKSLADPR